MEMCVVALTRPNAHGLGKYYIKKALHLGRAFKKRLNCLS